MVEVGGIPRKARENCEKIRLGLASKIRVDLKTEDIDACHRIPPKQDAPITVKLHSRKKSLAMLSKQAKVNSKKCRTADLGFAMPTQDPNSTNGASVKVYINECFTSRNKNILRLAKIKKRELDFKFVW